MKTTTRVCSVNEPRLYTSLFLWGRREPPLYHDLTHTCGNRPTHDPHVTHDPPRRAFNAGCGEAQRTRRYHSKKPAPPARAPFWARPNNMSRLCVAQARGLLSVYKSRGTPFYPFTCARTVGAAPTATLSRAGEGSRGEAKGTRRSETTPRQETQDSKGARWTPPARPLPGRPPWPRQEPCRGSLPNTSRASHP